MIQEIKMKPPRCEWGLGGEEILTLYGTLSYAHYSQ